MRNFAREIIKGSVPNGPLGKHRVVIKHLEGEGKNWKCSLYITLFLYQVFCLCVTLSKVIGRKVFYWTHFQQYRKCRLMLLAISKPLRMAFSNSFVPYCTHIGTYKMYNILFHSKKTIESQSNTEKKTM